MAYSLRPTPMWTQQKAFFPGGNAGEKLPHSNKVIETPIKSNSGQQNIDDATKLTFDSQQARDNMKIDNNDCFENLEDDSLSGNKQDQNQEADQLTSMDAAGQTTQLLPTGAAGQIDDQVRPLDKILQ